MTYFAMVFPIFCVHCIKRFFQFCVSLIVFRREEFSSGNMCPPRQLSVGNEGYLYGNDNPLATESPKDNLFSKVKLRGCSS